MFPVPFRVSELRQHNVRSSHSLGRFCTGPHMIPLGTSRIDTAVQFNGTIQRGRPRESRRLEMNDCVGPAAALSVFPRWVFHDLSLESHGPMVSRSTRPKLPGRR